MRYGISCGNVSVFPSISNSAQNTCLVYIKMAMTVIKHLTLDCISGTRFLIPSMEEISLEYTLSIGI